MGFCAVKPRFLPNFTNLGKQEVSPKPNQEQNTTTTTRNNQQQQKQTTTKQKQEVRNLNNNKQEVSKPSRHWFWIFESEKH